MIRAEFYKQDAPEEVVGAVDWSADGMSFAAVDMATADALEKAYRRTPVVVLDASLRRLGAHGESTLQPGDAEWFRAVTQWRAPEELGLSSRMVSDVREGGYDPASNYRKFEKQIQRLQEPEDSSQPNRLIPPAAATY